MRAAIDRSHQPSAFARLRRAGVPGPRPARARDTLGLSDLEKLNLPQDERGLSAEGISQFEAVRLFIARAVAVRPDFAVTNDNAPAVAAISARLHGMPLAIELAAARIKLLPPEAILSRLERQLGVLAAGSRDLPERQQTLRGAIAWSYDLLHAQERRLLSRLAVFVGGCELETAEEVCGPADDVDGDVLDGLLSLADQSLVKTEDVEGTTRFRLLETIREFAVERLAESGEQALIERRHTDAFLRLVEAVAPQLSGDDQRRWLSRLERDHDNIRTALERTTALPDAPSAIRLGSAMWRYWQKRGHLAEAQRRLSRIAAEPSSRDDPVLRARLMEALGGVGWWQADLESMVEAYEEALALWRSIGDTREIANALYNLAFRYAGQSSPGEDGGEGLRLMEEALALYRQADDDRGTANVLWGIGNYHYFASEPDQGADLFREALAIFERVGDRTMAAWSQHMLGSALVRRGRLDEAHQPLRSALRTFHDDGDISGLALVLDDLATESVAHGHLSRAARLWGAARALSSAGGVGLADFVDARWQIEGRPNVAAAMDREALERFAAEGRAMSLDDSIAYALDMPADVQPGRHDRER